MDTECSCDSRPKETWTQSVLVTVGQKKQDLPLQACGTTHDLYGGCRYQLITLLMSMKFPEYMSSLMNPGLPRKNAQAAIF
jgi:hypothetical protein